MKLSLLPGFPTEGRLERNSIAAFLLMVKNLIGRHPINQDGLLQCHGPSVIGAMLAKVSVPRRTFCGKGRLASEK